MQLSGSDDTWFFSLPFWITDLWLSSSFIRSGRVNHVVWWAL